MLTEKQASKRGFRLTRGAYAGTHDDRIDRWYWDEPDALVIDRRGSGFKTRREAVEALAFRLEAEAEE